MIRRTRAFRLLLTNLAGLKSVSWLLPVVCTAALAGSLPPSPWADRVVPLGGPRGTTITVEFKGRYLANTTGVRFDSEDIQWIETLEAASGKVRGRVRIAETAALGPHIVSLMTKDGRSNSRLFNVTQFPSTTEVEPNDIPPAAQPIDLRPQVVHGGLDELVDIDIYTFEADAGERWSFDLRSLEYGSHLECEMALLDRQGKRVAFNDDRDDYLETPFLEHVFEQAGTYYLKLDQYRGPQRVNCAANCGYMLRISKLPVIMAASPLGASVGSTARISIRGRSLESVDAVYLTPVRGAEYYRLTFPYSIPIHIGEDPDGAALPRLNGKILQSGPNEIEAEFQIPADARKGLWRLWAAGEHGTADGISLELTGHAERAEAESHEIDTGRGLTIVNGSLDRDRERDAYLVEVEEGVPLRFWTQATQLGLPYIDTVLEIFDEDGNFISEHDDLMSGQGTVIGNPDSSLVYTPKKSGTLKLVVRDRIDRGGPTYVYRLKINREQPRFRLLTDPENVNVPRGGEAEISVLLIREPGFEEAVDVWLEGLPQQIDSPRDSFRADQFFGPSADGDNVIIPAVYFSLKAPADLPLGDHPIRVFGKSRSTGQVVEAYTTLWIGPPRMRNDVRRPLPRVTMTVVEPFAARLTAERETIQLKRGQSSDFELRAESIPQDAEIRLGGAPPGISFGVLDREENRIRLRLSSSPGAAEGSFSVEARVGDRWAATAPIELTFSDPPEVSR